jgi:5-carboxymethyl-2-hydroxymuconate isomerase
MPHLRLDVSGGWCDEPTRVVILDDLIDAMAAVPTVDRASLKAYAQEWPTFRVGAGHPPNFCHLTVQVLDGRPTEIRAEMLAAVKAVLMRHLESPVANGQVKVTIELREMRTAEYFKSSVPGA